MKRKFFYPILCAVISLHFVLFSVRISASNIKIGNVKFSYKTISPIKILDHFTAISNLSKTFEYSIKTITNPSNYNVTSIHSKPLAKKFNCTNNKAYTLKKRTGPKNIFSNISVTGLNILNNKPFSNLACPTPHISYTNIQPTIDGTIDDCWGALVVCSFTNVTVPASGSIPGDFAGTQWRALYDNTYLYIFVEVKDANKYFDSGVNWYQDDCVEVFIDGDNSKGSTYDLDDCQYFFRYSDGAVHKSTSTQSLAGILFAQSNISGGYNIEIGIPWSTIGILPPVSGDLMGFDISVDDDDNGGNREAQVAWHYNTNVAYTDPSVFGTVTLCSGEPDVTITQAGGQLDPTNTSPVNFTATFSEPVIGFSADDVSLSVPAGATVAISGTGPAYNIAVSGMTGDGTVIVSINAGVCSDLAGNANTASINTDNSVSYDVTGPEVTITKAGGQLDPTNTSPINFIATFSEQVTGFLEGDVTVSGTAGATTVVVSGSGPAYNLAVSGMTGDGSVTVLINAGICADLSGNTNTASINTDNSVYFDNVKPDVTLTTSETSPTYLNQIPFTITFSKPVTDLAISDFNISNGTIINLIEQTPSEVWTAMIVPVSVGIIDVQLPVDIVADAAGNSNNASNHLQIEYLGQESINFEANNIFTPNGTLNRYWIIRGVNQYADYELVIKNSSGLQVYKTVNYQNDWNGTYKNKPLPTGTYYYFFTSPDKKTIYKGFVNIMYE